MAKCPECGALIDIEEDEVEEGEIFSCSDCGVDLEVVSLHPLELDVIEDEEEEEEKEGSEADEESYEDEGEDEDEDLS